MSYTDTPRLALKKANPGTNQPFETEVFNANLDKIDAEAVAIDTRLDSAEGRLTSVEADGVSQDGRLDAIEANNWVTAARLADNAVSTPEIVDGAVTTAKIADLNVTVDKLASNAVSTVKIINSAVTTAKIADLNVTTAKIADLNVTSGKLESTLDLSGKTVAVATQSAGNNSGLVANTAFVKTAVDASATNLNNNIKLAAGRILVQKSFSGAAPSFTQADIDAMYGGGHDFLRIEIVPDVVGSLSPTVAFYSGGSGSTGPATVDAVFRTFGSTSLTTSSATSLALGLTSNFQPYIIEVNQMCSSSVGFSAFTKSGSLNANLKSADLKISGVNYISKLVFGGTWTGASGYVNVVGWYASY